MTSPSNSDVQNLLPVQAYFNLDGSFNTFIGQGVPFTATISPIQSGLTITNSTINSSVIGGVTPAAGTFTSFATTTGTIATQPTAATDIVNLLALQSYAAGISWKNPVTAATTVNITLSGLQTVDTVSLVAGNTVLVKNQTDNTKNGIYQVNTGSWTYATGSTTWAQYVSALVFVEYGTQAGSAWYCTAQPGGTLGTTAMTWSNFSVASTYTAGTGLTLAGYQFSITPVGTANTYGSATATPVFTTNASGQVTAVTNTTITPALGSITGFGTGVATFLATPTSANLAAAVSDETGSGALVFANGPTLIAPALGTPASGVVTNLTGTASININGSVGATTPTTGAFTVLSTSSTTNTTPVLGFNASNSPLALGATISGSYLQVVMQNKSGTAGASTNWAVSNDLATDSSYYGEFGMNSSVFSASTPADFFSINNGIYFSGHDGDLSIGSGNGFKTYLAWGTTGQSAHVINATGAIGLSTNLGTTPATSGTTGFGTSGQVLTSQGSAAAPIWATPTTGTVTSVSGTAPISVATGTTTPVISISQATTSTNGYLSSTDWNTFNGKAPSVTYTTNYIPYGQGTTTPAQSTNLQFNGTTLTVANDASISGLTVGKGAGTTTQSTAFGTNALAGANTVGYNSAFGYGALATNTSGYNNTAVGNNAGGKITTGLDNTAIGVSTLGYNGAGMTGSNNVAVGDFALTFNTSASENTAIGWKAGYSNTTGTIDAFGGEALYSNTTGTNNVAVGIVSLYTNTTGSKNTATNFSLYYNTTGSNNTGYGYQSLFSNTTASYNTAVGYQAGYSNTTGTNLTAIGYQAGQTSNASDNTFVGRQAGQSTSSGASNTALGSTALANNSTGADNTALGKFALVLNTTGASNTAVGKDALYSNTTASNNTAVGYQAGYGITTGASNVCVGGLAGSNLTGGLTSTYVGYNSQASGVNAINELVVCAGTGTGKGTSTGYVNAGGGGVYQGNNSATWSITSDARLKKNIVDNNTGLDLINQIQVRNFEYRLPEEITELSETDAISRTGVQIGVIAQEIAEVSQEFVKTESTGVMSVDTDNLVWYLINAVKELKAEIDELKAAK